MPDMVDAVPNRINFAHLRNAQRKPNDSVHESGLFEGSMRILDVLTRVIRGRGSLYRALPYRPDHGHLRDWEAGQKTNPGYSYLGRLRNLAQLQGAVAALGSGLIAHS